MADKIQNNVEFEKAAKLAAQYGAGLDIKSTYTDLADLSASATATDLIPAGAVVFGVLVEVTTLATGAATFSVGDGTDADKWGTGIAVALGTKTSGSDFTAGDPTHYAAATSVVLTGDVAFTAGAARVVVVYGELPEIA